MPRGLVVGQGSHVEDRVVAAKRELEAVLSLGRAVAGSLVTAEPRQHGSDIVREVDVHRRVQPSTVTGTVAVLPASRRVKLPLPSALGRTNPERDTSTIPADS